MELLEEPQATFYVGLAISILRDDPLSLYSPKNLKKDESVLTDRSQHEGISFLTKVLPTLGKAVLSGIEIGTFSSSRCGFALGPSGRPLFLGAYLDVIFGRESSEEKRADALSFVLQLCFLCYKLEIPNSPSANAAVIENFVETEKSISELVVCDWAAIRHAQSLISDLFLGFDPKDISPKHGPGAVATGEKLWHKWRFQRLYDQIHQQYPYYDYFFIHSKASIADQKDQYLSLQRLETGVAKVVLVPKDSRGPRLISSEPLEYQYIQQGLASKLVPWIESSPLTKGFVNFSDQSINRDLALSCSRTRDFATMDLKDASDRVSVKLVTRLFDGCPSLLKCLMATRSTSTKLPDGRVVPLAKFAPMGSSLCFPVEALCFWSICVGAAMASGMTREAARQSVYVYGDDLIVRTHLRALCTVALEAVGLLVNTAKCYSESNFRESCGMDAYFGKQVTPVRCKKLFSGTRTGESFAAYTSMMNVLSSKGYRGTASYLLSNIERVYGRLPAGLPASSYPCLEVQNLANAISENRRRGIRMRWNSKLCRNEVRVLSLRSATSSATHSGWPRLLQNLLQPVRDQNKWAIRRATFLTRRWRSIGS
jgi:hypothetical protein